MDSPTDEAVPGPATYVPEPFEGLPPIFGAENPAARGWRARHRPPRAPRRRKPVPVPVPVEPAAAEAALGAPAAPDVPLIEQPPAPAAPAASPPSPPPPSPPPPPPPPPVRVSIPVPPPVAPPPPPPPPAPVHAPAPVPAAEPLPPPPAPPRPPAPPPVRVSLPDPPPVRVTEPQSPKWWPALPPPDVPVAVTPNYEPEPYDPRTAGAVLPAADILQLYGTVLRSRRRGGSVLTLVVLLAVLLATSFYAWREVQKNNRHQATDVSYTSVAGHFTARFPSAPQEQTSIERHGALRMRVQTVSDAADHVAVGSVRISAPIPKGQATAILLSLGKGLASQGALTVARQQRSTFRGHPAVEGELWAADGSPFGFLGMVFSARQLYVLLAPSGASYAQLKASFLPLG